MRTLRRVLLAVVFLTLVLLILIFVLENQEAVVLSFLVALFLSFLFLST